MTIEESSAPLRNPEFAFISPIHVESQPRGKS
jgi:hypothetical protein